MDDCIFWADPAVQAEQCNFLQKYEIMRLVRIAEMGAKNSQILEKTEIFVNAAGSIQQCRLFCKVLTFINQLF